MDAVGLIFFVFWFQLELIKPAICEDNEIWEMLEECWSRDEQMRPNFAQIYLFLKRKAALGSGRDVEV